MDSAGPPVPHDNTPEDAPPLPPAPQIVWRDRDGAVVQAQPILYVGGASGAPPEQPQPWSVPPPEAPAERPEPQPTNDGPAVSAPPEPATPAPSWSLGEDDDPGGEPVAEQPVPDHADGDGAGFDAPSMPWNAETARQVVLPSAPPDPISAGPGEPPPSAGETGRAPVRQPGARRISGTAMTAGACVVITVGLLLLHSVRLGSTAGTAPSGALQITGVCVGTTSAPCDPSGTTAPTFPTATGQIQVALTWQGANDVDKVAIDIDTEPDAQGHTHRMESGICTLTAPSGTCNDTLAASHGVYPPGTYTVTATRAGGDPVRTQFTVAPPAPTPTPSPRRRTTPAPATPGH